MKAIISNMLAEYEGGKVSRRALVQALGALVVAAGSAPAAESTFRGQGLNHIALRVTDIARSRDFYQRHFGLPVISQSEGNCFLGLGKDFLALFRGNAAAMDHYCIAIDGYKADAVVAELKRQGITSRRTQDRVYFPDPDGLTVQVSAADHQP